MKTLNRQTKIFLRGTLAGSEKNFRMLLIGGAAACLLLALMTLFSGSRVEPSSAPTPPSANTYSDPSGSEESAGGEASEPSALNPEFYQRVRQQLLAVTPAHQEPFVGQDRAARPASSPNEALRSQPGGSSLPVLPIALQPSASMQIGSPSRVDVIPSEARNLGSPESSPPNSATASTPTNTPRLRGQIRDHISGKIAVLFELNGTLHRASNEPNAEWRIVKIEPRQITVRNGKQTLILEVPYAP